MADTNRFVGAVERESFRGSTEVVVFYKLVLDPRAKMAEEFIQRWGVVAGTPDGEDSAGRSKLRLQTVDELVTRACGTADALYAEVERRGWLVAIPEPKFPAKE